MVVRLYAILGALQHKDDILVDYAASVGLVVAKGWSMDGYNGRGNVGYT